MTVTLVLGHPPLAAEAGWQARMAHMLSFGSCSSSSNDRYAMSINTTPDWGLIRWLPRKGRSRSGILLSERSVQLSVCGSESDPSATLAGRKALLKRSLWHAIQLKTGPGLRVRFVERNVSRPGGAGHVLRVADVDEASVVEKGTEQQLLKTRGGNRLGEHRKGSHFSGGYWRLFRVKVLLENDLGKDDASISQALLEGIASSLKCSAAQLSPSSFAIVRKALDARKDPLFVYTIDLDVEDFLRKVPFAKTILSKLRARPGKVEFSSMQRSPVDLVTRLERVRADIIHTRDDDQHEVSSKVISTHPDLRSTNAGNVIGLNSRKTRPRVVVVGCGPAGLFAALVLAESGTDVVLLERGQPVERRGRDIGALMVRRLMDPNSNLCFGEGGAGTWSDGKLTTRIGKNSSSVQTVLATLVRFGAPPQILVDGKPHVGTDKLVRILQNLRSHLLALGVRVMFGTKMEDLEVRAGRVTGVRISTVDDELNKFCHELLEADAVMLGVGHSARDVYEMLCHHNVLMTAKPFAVGFRVEHPQELVNEMQYKRWANEVKKGKGKLPVADYSLAADIGFAAEDDPVAENGKGGRGCFSFCMCPGGQVVLTSTSSSELCINGMSFSNRSSKWANAALVVSVSNVDFATPGDKDVRAGVAFQRAIEQEAAIRGGGKFVAPVQTVTDFLDCRLSGGGLPSSSYRLGVKAAFLHDLLPYKLTESLQEAIVAFEQQLPGFINKQALLHGVETRTSSPVRIERSKETFESVSLPGLYPIGEGAGHAGGIVSAAVDGMLVGLAVVKNISPSNQYC